MRVKPLPSRLPPAWALREDGRAMKLRSDLLLTLGESDLRHAATALLALLALASALGWGWAVWRAFDPALGLAVTAPAPAPPPVLLSAAELAQGLGASPAAPPAPRLLLLGVIAASSGQGVALIAAEGEPPRPFRVGAQVLPGLLLQRLGPREAVLAPSRTGPPRLRLALTEGLAAPAPSPEPTPATEPGAAQSEPWAVQPSPRGQPRGP